MSPTESVPFTDLAAMTRDVRAAVEQAWAPLLSSSRFVGGAAVEVFEQEWASYCGVAHAVGVGSGTDALLLTLRALGIGAGDDVIVPANTFIASAEAVVLAGATPVFADVSPDTLLLTPEELEAANNLPGGERVCIPDWRGLRLSVMTAFVETPPPNPADVLTIARKLHPIGPNLAHWTADLLR